MDHLPNPDNKHESDSTDICCGIGYFNFPAGGAGDDEAALEMMRRRWKAVLRRC